MSKRTSYGQRGGEGPTRGKKSVTYTVTLPDSTVVTKRAFGNFTQPTGYAYQLDGKWHVAGINEKDAWHLMHYTQCPAVPR